jgi:DNA-binding NarL/FixJ family response regulator
MLKVLIADDSDSVRIILRDFLALRSGVEVCGEAVNGLEAVEKAKTLAPDLVLMDLAMPKMNGAAATSVLKQAMPELFVVLFTMYGENVGRQLASAIRVDAVLCKPNGLRELNNVIDSVLGRSPAPSDPGPESRRFRKRAAGS